MRELIETWHGRDRLHYAITVRFALTSSEAQLASTGRLAREYPEVFIHSHLAENTDEVEAVRRQFPVGSQLPRASTTASGCCASAPRTRTASISMRPTGGGWPTAAPAPRSAPAPICISAAACSTWRPAMRPACATRSPPMSAAAAASACCGRWRKPTRWRSCAATIPVAAARVLSGDAGRRTACFGCPIASVALRPGIEADFIVLDPEATPLLARRTAQSGSLSELLLVLMTLADDRAIAATYVLGELQELA